MTSALRHTSAPLITTIQKLFGEDLARENDFLRQENKILRSKLGKRVPLTDTDRRTPIRYGLPIQEPLSCEKPPAPWKEFTTLPPTECGAATRIADGVG